MRLSTWTFSRTPQCSWWGPSACRRRRRARFCRRRLTAGAAERATRLAVRRGFHSHRSRPRGLQSWPGGGSRRPWPACGRHTSFLNVHVQMTHATSRTRSHEHCCFTSCVRDKRLQKLQNVTKGWVRKAVFAHRAPDAAQAWHQRPCDGPNHFLKIEPSSMGMESLGPGTAVCEGRGPAHATSMAESTADDHLAPCCPRRHCRLRRLKAEGLRRELRGHRDIASR